MGISDSDRTDPAGSRTIASTLAADIRADIIEGRLLPGAKLRIRDLEARYGAGPIPLREALFRLSASGFVVATDQKGFRVSEVSAADLRDITDTRVFIECEALRRSIEVGDIEWEQRLVSTHFRVSRLPMLKPDGRSLSPPWELAHHAFHAALLSACGSRSLLALAQTLREQSVRYRNLSLNADRLNADPNRNVQAEHLALFDAAMARDAPGAADALERHIRATTALVLQLIDTELRMPSSAPAVVIHAAGTALR